MPLHEGVLSRAGWYLLDDTRDRADRPPTAASPRARRTRATTRTSTCSPTAATCAGRCATCARSPAPAPLLPRKAFGVWYSRYWPYSAADWQALIARFRSEKVPLDTISLDTDYKRVTDPVGAAIAATVAGAPGLQLLVERLGLEPRRSTRTPPAS